MTAPRRFLAALPPEPGLDALVELLGEDGCAELARALAADRAESERTAGEVQSRPRYRWRRGQLVGADTETVLRRKLKG